ncbi:MAG: S41 family peptidase [Muribaculaceae bacterium]|nr:S41 family peptidase [Muribaculaceae bacterium]
MKKAVVAIITLIAGACHNIPSWENSVEGNFDALWTILDEHYCFFGYKGLDWDEIGREYRAQITSETDARGLFDICSSMLDRLEDGHVNLSSPFAVSYYRKWWSDYPQNFDWRLIQEHYLEFDYTTGGGLSYKELPEGVGYVRYDSFAYSMGESFLDAMFLNLKECPGLILDVRDNGGGDVTRVEQLVSRFLDHRIEAGAICHKTGPGHDEFSEPYKFYYDPQMQHVRWLRKVVVLTNRSTFSAANQFVAIMKTLPNVIVVGDCTGGGDGMPFSSSLPCGWGVRFSASPVYDPMGQLTEWGVEPTEGCRVDMDPEAAFNGKDTILDFAIALLVKDKEKDSALN